MFFFVCIYIYMYVSKDYICIYLWCIEYIFIYLFIGFCNRVPQNLVPISNTSKVNPLNENLYYRPLTRIRQRHPTLGIKATLLGRCAPLLPSESWGPQLHPAPKPLNPKP